MRWSLLFDWISSPWVRRAIAGSVAVVLLGAVVGARSGQMPQQPETISLLDDPLAKFGKLMPALQHPRCANCHGGSNPFTGINHPANVMLPSVAANLQDLNGDHDFVAKGNDVCTTCHDLHIKGWVLAHKFSAFFNRSAHQICSTWKNATIPFPPPLPPALPGRVDSAEALLKHLETDDLIQIAFLGDKNSFEAGVGVLVDPPQMSFDEFFTFAQDWLKGSTNIPCRGWVGTITQTEHVKLTTNYGVAQLASAGIEEHTTEVQEATRTTEITVDGRVGVSITVHGMHSRNHTLKTGQGAQACTITENGIEQFDSPAGPESAEAPKAEVTFFPGGAYSISIVGPEEEMGRTEKVATTHCVLGPLPIEPSEIKLTNFPWTVVITGTLPNSNDRSVLKGNKTVTITDPKKAWLTASGGRVSPFQERDNGQVAPVPVEVTTTWDLRRLQ